MIPTIANIIEAVLITKNAMRANIEKPIENNIPILLAPSIQNPISPRKNNNPEKILTIKIVITHCRTKNHMSKISQIIPIGRRANEALPNDTINKTKYAPMNIESGDDFVL